MGALTARLSAALNRSTLLSNADQPNGAPSTYYQVSPTNHYSRLVPPPPSTAADTGSPTTTSSRAAAPTSPAPYATRTRAC